MIARVSTAARRPPRHAGAAVTKERRAAPDDRAGFVRRVAEAFDGAGVEYVVLHGLEPDGVDSDLDVAVARSSLAVVDALVRLGTFGRPLQCLHYDIPWCRWYVLETGDPQRPYRQLDVACDPWGVGRYGPAIPLALDRAQRLANDGLRTPDPAAEVVYLAAKRARKGLARAQDARQLRRAFARCPEEAHDLLERVFGRAGAAVADALAHDQAIELPVALARLRRRIALRRATPSSIVRCALLSAARLGGRLARPSGLVVWVTGPDGVGKSTLAAALEGTSRGAFRRFTRRHLGPSVLVRPSRLLRRAPAIGDDPHDRSPSGVLGSIARLVYLWLDMTAAWLPQITLPRLRSSLVVVERGWLDLDVDPRRYRIDLPRRAVSLFGALLPKPDLVLVLDAPASEIRGRKAELPVVEIERQLGAWRAHAAADPERFAIIDASADIHRSLAQASGAICDRLALRQRDLTAYAFALRCLGGVSVGGDPYALLGTGARARWLLPARTGAPGPLRAGLYRPARVRHRAGALTIEHARRLATAQRRLGVDIGSGIAPAIAVALGVDRAELAVALTRDSSRGDRLLISVLDDGRPIAFAKVARTEDRARLDHERRVLEALASSPLQALRVPEVITVLEWQDCSALLLRPVEVGGRADRPLGAVEVAGLTELARLGASLAPVLGEREGLIPSHGDFAPWNSSSVGGRLTLWDWEASQLGLPLEDFFHWRIQRLALFGEGTVASLVDGAFEPDDLLGQLLEVLGARREDATAALRAALEGGVVWPRTAEQAQVLGTRREALELLSRRGA